MASFIATNETLTANQAGQITRHGAFITNRTLNQAAGSVEGLLLAPSGTTGDECIAPSTAALVAAGIGFSVFRPMSEDFSASVHYADNEAVDLMESGHMAVLCEGTCVANQPVFIRHTSDGGSNTVLGKVAANGGGTVVIDTTAAAVEGQYSVELYNGVVKEKFSVDSDGSQTAVEILTALTAAIDASANYSAAGTTEVTITLVAGNRIEVVELSAPTAVAQALWTVVDNQKCAVLPGAFFDASRSGAGLVEIRFNKVN